MIKTFKNYRFNEYIKKLDINYNDFNLYGDEFDHKSSVHGINHTFRVMFNCLLIGYSINNIIDTKRAFMAAYIHDMARKHDNSCKNHGPDSAKEKLPLYTDLFYKNGLNNNDIRAIKLAVANHCQLYEIDKNNPYYITTAILRDADGLDLVRLDREIRPDILRFRESMYLIKSTEKLFNKTDDKQYNRFIDFLKENIDLIYIKRTK